MCVFWIYPFVLYTHLISGGIGVSMVTRCQSIIPNDGIRINKNICYTVHKSKKTWRNAELACKQLDGGKLAAMEDLEFLLSFYELTASRVVSFVSIGVGGAGSSQPTYWIGAKDRGGGNFYWLDGRPIPFIKWAPNLFSKVLGWLDPEENCLAMGVRGYEKFTCSTEMGYVCEHDFSSHDSLTSGNVIKPQGTDAPEKVTSALQVTDNPIDNTKGHGVTVDERDSRGSSARPQSREASDKAIPKSENNEGKSEDLKTNEHDSSKREPPVNYHQLFLGIKIVEDQFNPRLTAKPNQIEKIRGLVECLRVCHDVGNCGLVNFSRPDHCAVYLDAVDALNGGAVNEPGWSVWKNLMRGR